LKIQNYSQVFKAMEAIEEKSPKGRLEAFEIEVDESLGIDWLEQTTQNTESISKKKTK
jgi:hypothetical protein